MTRTEDALLELLEVASVQLAVLEDAARKPTGDRGALAASSLDLLLRAMGTSSGAIAADPEASTRLRAASEALSRRVTAYAATHVALAHHLLDLAEGWACAHCKAQVPAGAEISGVRAGLVRVELVCKRCQRVTRLAPAGQRCFDRVFGPLVGTDWNPAVSGFAWNGR